MPLDVVETLSQLVRIPSVNPMGRDVSGPQYFEQAVTNHLQTLFTSQGWQWERHPVLPQRDNIVARLEGSQPLDQGGKLLVWEAHQDTVPVEGMTIPPWEPTIQNGRLYGRGSCDIKGGMAAMLAAASRLAEQPQAQRPTIVLACTVNEEYGYSGASALTELWKSGQSALLPRKPDGIVVAEPTSLDVVIAHKGVSRWRCHTHGKAAHSSNPAAGENAIYAMGRVLACLETYARDIAPQIRQHRLVGGPTLSVGVIAGGISVNTVADHCVIEIDRRVLPGEDPLVAQQAVIDYLSAQLPPDVRVTHDHPYIYSGGLSDENNLGLAEQVSAAIQRCGGPGRLVGVPYGTNASAYSPHGAPAVVFGPGSIAQAHTVDEWIEIAELEAAVEMLVALASSYE
ncbi:MAG TPA: M20 family metallopeptidase [Pirellulaceae bacterium]|nr:M20 family metallopeptidase [Pirellulaceae bacterium]